MADSAECYLGEASDQQIGRQKQRRQSGAETAGDCWIDAALPGLPTNELQEKEESRRGTGGQRLVFDGRQVQDGTISPGS